MLADGYNNVDHFGDGYMEQEEEWEREGLLDPAWEKQQKKVTNDTDELVHAPNVF